MSDGDPVYPSESTEVLRHNDGVPRIALDMDGVVAETKTEVFKYMGEEVAPADMTHWEWPAEEFGRDRFISAFNNVWSSKWYNVSPKEPIGQLRETIENFRGVYLVDIVTSQAEDDMITRGKRAWLEYNEVPYDNLVPVPIEKTKAELGYDVYIDDKPYLPASVNDVDRRTPVYLIDHHYNRDAPGDYVRVNTVAEAKRHFVFGTTAENPAESITTYND